MRDQHWIDVGLRPILAAMMLACLAAPVVTLVAELTPPWPATYLFVFSFVANLEGMYSERLLSRQRITGWSYLGSRAAEAITLLLLLKLGSYQALGWPQLLADARRWATEPGEFLSAGDMLAGLALLLLWAAAIGLSRTLSQLDAVPDTPPEDRTSAEYYLWMTQPQAMTDRQELLAMLAERFLIGGMALLIVLSGIQIVFSESRLFLAAALGYFALGIVLLSQAQFSVLQTTWQVQQIEVQPTISRRWLVWAAAFLAMVTLVALLLPTTYTMLPLQALLAVMGLLINTGMFVLLLAVYAAGLLLAWLFPAMDKPMPPAPPAMPTPPPSSQGASPGPPWLQTVLSALFWLVVLSIILYAVVRFARERMSVEPGAGEGWWDRAVAWLREMWRRWWRWGRGVSAQVSRRLARRPQGAEAHGRAPRGGGWLGLRRLAPRELVRYFYLSTLERASRAGLARRPGQTPYEYRASLEHELPEVEPDLAGLTDAFVVARYSPKPVEPEEARAVKPLWERVRAALRRKRPEGTRE
jgi:hypothetical protein